MKYTSNDIVALNARFADSAPEELLQHFTEVYGNHIALSSSLSIENQSKSKDFYLGYMSSFPRDLPAD